MKKYKVLFTSLTFSLIDPDCMPGSTIRAVLGGASHVQGRLWTSYSLLHKMVKLKHVVKCRVTVKTHFSFVLQGQHVNMFPMSA